LPAIVQAANTKKSCKHAFGMPRVLFLAEDIVFSIARNHSLSLVLDVLSTFGSPGEKKNNETFDQG